MEELRELILRSYEEKPKLAIVIDDFGYNLEQIEQFLQISEHINFAVLPFLPLSKQISTNLYYRDKSILLHMPMQPIEWAKFDPGPGALITSDSEEKIYKKISEGFDSVLYARGMNNHMGSLFTNHREGMEPLFKFLNEKNFFFLDSKTAATSFSRELAEIYGVKYLARDIFLDNEIEHEKILEQLYKATKLAVKRGKRYSNRSPTSTNLSSIIAGIT